jgi:acetate kinase
MAGGDAPVKILVLNGGSSTLKLTLREMDGEPPAAPPPPLWDALADWGRHPGHAFLRVRRTGAEPSEREVPARTLGPVFRELIKELWSGPESAVSGPREIGAVGHRIVHGGPMQHTARIDPEVRNAIRRAARFAPAHNPIHLQGIEAVEEALGSEAPQFAVFDTAFHATIPQPGRVYPIPFEFYEEGIARYGFHGISHQYVSRRAAQILNRPAEGLRVISCHLGNGASLAAIASGKSVDTTMGFTPLEGLMMGTRSGSVDPGVLIYLAREHGYRAARLDRVLNKESGLKGVSGVSGDMREVMEAMARGNERARLAFDVYAWRLVREAGGMAASLGGVDALIFTGGIGENCAPLREIACERLSFLGIRIDRDANGGSPGPVDADIAAHDSRVRVLVVHTEEDWEIARECRRAAAEPGVRRSSSAGQWKYG